MNSPVDIKKIIKKLLKINATSVSKNIINEINKAYDIEISKGNDYANKQLELILENLAYGKENELPICQDTGMINIIVKFNSKFNFQKGFINLVKEAISEATREIPLRPNTVDPFTAKNNKDNLGLNSPPIYFELDENIEYLEIYIINKGGGSENMSRMYMMPSSSDLIDIEKKIIEVVNFAGGKPCPPIILGIGIGGDATYCMYLAKKALLRSLKSRNPRKIVSEMEKRLLNEINKTNIGTMGLGGAITCLDVRIEYAMRHPASYPLGIIVQCYSHRISHAIIHKDGKIIINQNKS